MQAHSACASSFLVDLDSSEKYIDSNDNLDESSNNNFMELDNLDDANLAIEQLCAASVVEAAIESLKITKFFSITQSPIVDNDESYEDFQDQDNQGDDEFDEELDEELDKKEKKICIAIEYVEEVMNNKVLSPTKEAHYLAVFYFLRLCLQDQKKIKASKTVTSIVNRRFSSKSLLYDKFVSLQVASYLRSKKFKVDPIMVKSYFEQEILPLLNNKSVQYILVRTAQSEQLLRKKGLGSAMHISDFLIETIGPLKDDQEEARVIMVKRAIDIFEQTHPECVGVFAFDNATSHKAFFENALVASKMNLGPGGSAPKMRKTVWSSGCQSMIIENDHIVYNKKKKTYVNFCRQPKGIQWVLDEKSL
ncbi:25305_t:CDS:2 [Gigaspora margarita]|uniref:25305_t:CDS:1 n=1 Tax=Gigaspora margarita TaxID=4874 RepID=A0ABN7W2Z4_GIGMA|nr:25305_t:CDS:2 [Gigaspora margarita]